MTTRALDAGDGASRRAPAEHPAFDALLAAAATGAGWACTRIWLDYAPPVAAFLRSRGSADPDDLTSEVFLAVFEQLPAFRGGEAELRSFIFSVAYRRLVDELRRRSRRGETAEFVDERDPRSVPSAEEEALRRLGDQNALALLSRLTDDQRDVLMLRIVADLSLDEVARIVGKRVGAVKALQRRALEALRHQISAGRILSDPAVDSEK